MERAAKLLVKKTLSKSITYYRKVNDSLRSKYMLDNNPNYSTNVINNNFMKDIEIVIKKELNTVFI